MLHNVTIRQWFPVFILVLTGLVIRSSTEPGFAGEPSPSRLTEHPIIIDATRLVPVSWWQVPGVTPSIWGSDPESLDAPKTSELRELRLKPGKYKFISFTFDFPFTVNLNGALDFSKSLDQCVEGRGTRTLVVLCKRMYPYGGQPDAYYDRKPNDG